MHLKLGNKIGNNIDSQITTITSQSVPKANLINELNTISQTEDTRKETTTY